MKHLLSLLASVSSSQALDNVRLKPDWFVRGGEPLIAGETILSAQLGLGNYQTPTQDGRAP